MVGMLDNNGYEKMHEQSRRVYSANSVAPTLHTCGGGNLEPKIIEQIVLDEQNGRLRKDGTVGTLTTDGSSPKHNNRIVEVAGNECTNENSLCVDNGNLRIRKLTERECFRLMAVKDKDFEKIEKNQAMSSLYHLAGDSIVTTCLMAIFGEMLDIDYEKKIKEIAANWEVNNEKSIKTL